MPRQARIDAPGALHHIVCRGIERRWIFREDADRDNFVERLGFLIKDSDFVNNVLKEAAESIERKYKLKAEGADFENIVRKVAEIFNIDERNLLSPGKDRLRSQARSLLCYIAVKELGESATKTAEKVGMSQPAVSKTVRRGKMIAGHYGRHIFNPEKS